MDRLAAEAYGSDFTLPEITLEDHLDATFPYVFSQLQYIIGKIICNAIQAVHEKYANIPSNLPLLCTR